MSRISEQIRAAALGPAPKAMYPGDRLNVSSWIFGTGSGGHDAHSAVMDALEDDTGHCVWRAFCDSEVDDQRLFLLEVAESLE